MLLMKNVEQGPSARTGQLRVDVGGSGKSPVQRLET